MKSIRPHCGEGSGCLNATACRKFKLLIVLFELATALLGKYNRRVERLIKLFSETQ